jgi:hypothetical protein
LKKSGLRENDFEADCCLAAAAALYGVKTCDVITLTFRRL